ncbi:hypothetical protein V8F33_005861 [Rhypophila sp. PSN 637]
MVHSNPDLASSAAPGETARDVEETGTTGEPFVQMMDNNPRPSRLHSTSPAAAARDLVLKASGEGSPTSTDSSSNLTRAVEGNGDMAVEAPVLRHSPYSFESWGSHKKDQDEDGCPGCAKINKARTLAAAAATVVATATAVVAQRPPATRTSSNEEAKTQGLNWHELAVDDGTISPWSGPSLTVPVLGVKSAHDPACGIP